MLTPLAKSQCVKARKEVSNVELRGRLVEMQINVTSSV